MTRIEFLQRRKSGIGGSDVAAIMGLSKWRTALDVWRDKMSDEIPADEDNPILKISAYLEQYAAQEYEAETGKKVRRWSVELINSDYPFLKGNIDRQILLDDRGVGILECKALSTFNFKRVEMYGLPDEYICQIQHYFLCGNGAYKWGAFAIVNRDNGRLLTFEIMPDAALQAEIVKVCVPFWTESVEKRIQPVETTPAQDAKIALPKFDGTITDLTGDEKLNALCAERVENAKLVDEAKALLAQTDAQICAELGDTEAAECRGARLYYKSSSRTTLDSTRLKKEKPELFKEYSKTTETARSLRFYAISGERAANL